MRFRSSIGDDWELRHENTREGELYREKERLREDLEQTQYRQRQDEYEREQQGYRTQLQRERDQENRMEERMNIMQSFENKDAEIEYLELCLKFGIEEVES